MACVGGVSSGCRNMIEVVFVKVTCVNTTNPTNLIEENVPEVELEWNVTCQMAEYKVEIHNGCRSLACIGGVPGGLIK